MTSLLPFSPLLAAESVHWPLTLAAWCVLIALASYAGGTVPVLLNLSHRSLQMVISFVAGLMLGVGILHVLPHAALELGSVDNAMLGMLAGVLVMFFLLRAFHFHHHGGPAEEDHAVIHAACPHGHDHDHHHDHDHSRDHGHGHAHVLRSAPQPHAFSWLGIAFGLTIHTLIDGVALASMVQVDAREGTKLNLLGVPLLGLPAFLAIVLHKPLDAAAITSLMKTSGWNESSRRMINVAFALMVPLGVLLFVFGAASLDARQHQFVGWALAFSGGVFTCIALADLLPEIEFHSHDRVLLSALLFLGVLVAWGVGLIEPRHLHGPVPIVPR